MYIGDQLHKDLGNRDPSRKVKSGCGVYLGTLIYVRTPSGDVVSLDISKETTVSDLKAILESELLQFPGAEDVLLLYHGEQELDSGGLPIDNGTALRLSFKLSNGEDIASYSPTFDIQCRDITRELFTTIGVDETLSVLDVVLLFYAGTGISPRMLKIMFGGRQLENFRLLREYDITSECTLIFVPSLRRGFSLEAPASFLASYTGSPLQPSHFSGSLPGAFLVALHPWSGDMQSSDVLGLEMDRGELLVCQNLVCTGWLYCTSKRGKEGFVPTTHVSILRIFKQSLFEELKATSSADVKVPGVSSPPVKRALASDESTDAPKAEDASTSFWCCLLFSSTSKEPEVRMKSEYFPPWDPNLSSTFDLESILKASPTEEPPSLPPFPYPDPEPPTLLKHELDEDSQSIVAFEISCGRLKSPSDTPTVLAVVKCLASSPHRISSISLSFHLLDVNEILEVSPQEYLGRETHTELSLRDNKTHKVRARAGVGALGDAVNLGGEYGYEREKGVEKVATKVTQMSIKGVILGGKEARWVLKEDESEAGREGLPTLTNLSMKVRFKPRRIKCEYRINAVTEVGIQSVYDGTSDLELS